MRIHPSPSTAGNTNEINLREVFASIASNFTSCSNSSNWLQSKFRPGTPPIVSINLLFAFTQQALHPSAYDIFCQRLRNNHNFINTLTKIDPHLAIFSRKFKWSFSISPLVAVDDDDHHYKPQLPTITVRRVAVELQHSGDIMSTNFSDQPLDEQTCRRYLLQPEYMNYLACALVDVNNDALTVHNSVTVNKEFEVQLGLSASFVRSQLCSSPMFGLFKLIVPSSNAEIMEMWRTYISSTARCDQSQSSLLVNLRSAVHEQGYAQFVMTYRHSLDSDQLSLIDCYQFMQIPNNHQ